MVKRVGKYELHHILGTGYFSKVKMGVDTETQQKCAIKIINKQELEKHKMQHQLRREIAVMKLLNHKHIVELFDVLQTTNNIYIIMEVISGGELFDKITKAERFTEPVARRFFQQLMAGVLFCHDQGIAHRDLKPENLLLDANDNLKISDFGLCNLIGPDGLLMMTVCGTPNYAAPEVLQEQPYNGFIADIWSSGVILFVMLAGYLPFEGKRVAQILDRILKGDFRMPPNLSPEVQDLIRKMMQMDPAKRYTMPEIIKHPWFTVDLDPKMFQKEDKINPTDDQEKNTLREVQELLNDEENADSGACSIS